MTRLLLFALLLLPLAACSIGPMPDSDLQIQRAVASTRAALPSPTPAPTRPLMPTPTPFSLTGLFCEYRFCIGHPPEMPFYDVIAKQNPNSPAVSVYENGILAAHTPTLFLQLIWQRAPGASDPIFLIELLVEDALDSRLGVYETRQMDGLSVILSPITTTASPLLPFGGVAGWLCNDRAFAWKAYTPQEGMFEGLLQEAIARFRCE